MSKKDSKSGGILLGAGLALAIGFAVAGVIVFNKRKRQGEYDFLIKVIDANQDEASLAKQKNSPFDKNYYKQNPKCVSIDNSEAQRQAKALHDAKRFFKDDVSSVESVFKNIKYKCDVSRIADAFYGLYKVDMLVYLANEKDGFLNQGEMEKYVYNYTNSLQ